MVIRLDVKAIRRHMVEKRLTGAALARLAGCTPQHVSTVLTRGTCNITTAGLLADALGVDVEYIWKED